MTELILGFILGVLFSATFSIIRWELQDRKARRAAALEARISAEVERRASASWEDKSWMGPRPSANGNQQFQPIRHP